MMRVFATALLLVCVSVVGNPVLGQEVSGQAAAGMPAKKGTGKSQAGAMLDAEAAEAMKPSGRLPRYFSSLVTSEQRVEIYRIQAAFMERTRQLEEQLAAIKMEEQAAFEAVLDDAQRKQLVSLRDAAMERAKEMRASRVTAASRVTEPDKSPAGEQPASEVAAGTGKKATK